MRYHQPQGHFRHSTSQLRESTQNNQDCQTPSLSRQPILQTAGLSQNPDFQKNEIQKSENKPGLKKVGERRRTIQLDLGPKIGPQSLHR